MSQPSPPHDTPVRSRVAWRVVLAVLVLASAALAALAWQRQHDLRQSQAVAADDPAGRALLERLDAIDWPALGRAFIQANAWRAHGRAIWTEKLPSNALLLGCIARALPRARFVHTAQVGPTGGKARQVGGVVCIERVYAPRL